MIKLQDARIADGLPRVVAEQPWAKVLSAVYGELQGRMLEYLATGMTFSDVDNCSEGMQNRKNHDAFNLSAAFIGCVC